MKSRTMLTLPLLTMLLLGLVAVAGAADKEDILHGPTVLVPRAAEGARATGDDCTDPILIDSLPYYGTDFTNCGRGNTYDETCLGNYDGGEDIMFQLDILETVTISITMDPQGTGWTGILLADACPPDAECIATNTGSSGIRTIADVTLDPGSYFIMVDTWPTPDCIPSFDLTVEEYTPPPPVSFCELLQDVEENGTFTGDTCGGENLITSLPCISYTENGLEDYYEVFMPSGSFFTVDLFHSVDSAIWVLDACVEPFTCLAGVDAAGANESITYENEGEDTYVYLVIDSYGNETCGEYTFEFTQEGGAVATKLETFSSVKSIFR